MIFCSNCGTCLSGQKGNSNDRRYYRHLRKTKSGWTLEKWVPASLIENTVLLQLLRTFGDIERIQKAVEKATPDMAKLEGLFKEEIKLKSRLKKVLKGKEAIINKVVEWLLTNAEIEAKMGALRSDKAHIKSRLSSIQAEMAAIPDKGKVKRLSKLALGIMRNATQHSPNLVFEKPYKWKRNLVQHAFGDVDSQGRRLGVYVSETGDREQPWTIEIRGVLDKTVLGLPPDDEYLEEIFHLDPEYQVDPECQDLRQELQSIRSNITKLSESMPWQSCCCLFAWFGVEKKKCIDKYYLFRVLI